MLNIWESQLNLSYHINFISNKLAWVVDMSAKVRHYVTKDFVQYILVYSSQYIFMDHKSKED